MAVLPTDIVAQMRSQLALTEPDLDTTVGTTVRKILDAVAESVAEAYADRYLLTYQYDLDAKTGADLDDMVALFTFTRLAAKRASGTVTFQRTGTSDRDILIPAGTQLTSDDASPVVVQTLVPAMLMRSDTTVSVPAQAAVGGVRGNIGASTLSRAITPVEGVGTFTNPVAFTGGTEAESDEQLRLRFKRTVFRAMAGTESMFIGTALEDPDVSQVNVIGASKVHREQIQIISGTATSTLTGIFYTYPGSSVLGASIDAGNIAILNVHYTFDSVARSVTVIGGSLPDGIYELEYEYVPTSSRNDPANGVTNRVDVYCNGTRATEAIEVAIFRTARVFNTTVGDPLKTTNFLRPNGTAPTSGNYFIDLSFGPVLDVSTTNHLVINSISYTEGTHYFTVSDITANGGTAKGLSGIEFVSAANGNPLAIPANGQTFTVDYVYNAVPGSVENAIRAWRLLTTDVRVHTAKQFRLKMSLIVILNPGQVVSTVKPAIEASLANYLSGVGFAGVVQVSDLLEAAASTPGVDAVRFATSTDDAVSYAIQRMSETGTVLTTYATGGRAIDVILGDDSLPVFDSLTLTVKALNSFGVL